MDHFITLSVPNFEGNELKYVEEAIETEWVSTGGAYIERFEKSLAAFLRTENVAACQSGTAAIHMSLCACGIIPGDAVIVPSLTFIAAVNPVKYQFAEPIFMDCDDTLCMDPVKLRSFCENECIFRDGKLLFHNHHIKAIVVVHVFGNMADMEKIMKVAAEYNLSVIEDATEALGTRYDTGKYSGKYAGTIGDYGCYSFNGNKIITTGGGGAVTSRNSSVVDHLRYLSTQAKDDPLFYIHNAIGWNYRMTNLQAAVGVAQMEELEEFIERKQKNYELYKELFDGYELCSLLPFREGIHSNKWFYSLMIDRKNVKASLRIIIRLLSEKNIQTRPIWGLIHEQRPYENSYSYKIEKAKKYSECILNIPCGTKLTGNEAEYVADSVKEVLDSISKGER